MHQCTKLTATAGVTVACTLRPAGIRRTPTSTPSRGVQLYSTAGARPKAWPLWDAIKVIVPLIAIAVVVANLLGLWATAAQIKARADRKAFADWSKARQEEDDKLEQEKKEREKHFQELFKF